MEPQGAAVANVERDGDAAIHTSSLSSLSFSFSWFWQKFHQLVSTEMCQTMDDVA